VVTTTLARDSRIGGKFLTPALAFGGPCFPRDNAAFAALARRLNVRADIPDATDSINLRQAQRIVEVVRNLVPFGRVGILGMAYKPNTNVVEKSASIAMASQLADAGYQVLTFDPEAQSAAAAVLGTKAEAVASARECAERSDVLIIATPWPQFRNLPLAALTRPGRALPVVDCWRLLPVAEFAQTVELIYLGQYRPLRLGLGPSEAAHEDPAMMQVQARG
jgi:UDPglucose 6-dehydrogenase